MLTEKLYIDNKAPHAHDIANGMMAVDNIVENKCSSFQIIPYNQAINMDDKDTLAFLRKGIIIETDRPLVKASFNKKGMSCMRTSLTKVISILGECLMESCAFKYSLILVVCLNRPRSV